MEGSKGGNDSFEGSPPDGDNPHRPICSVLSTVINHYMIPPTPLEPEEYRQSKDGKSAPIQVPILRVFGPIIRGEAPSGKDPVQSACLYIHGAFPYMLARPVTAGPDGSLHHSSHLELRGPSLTSSGHVDWDSPLAVERVASTVQKTLEAALQATMTSFDQDKGKSAPLPQEKIPKFIRSIKVVMGRGFYTYCPGPAAPFLRVEYYDPRVRWKVKMMLEKGLDLPHMYHPDPQQYDAVGLTPAADSSQLGLDPLSFHCYEAHIPYSMQFFKDWNLAGMAYIHLSQGKFRRHLPSVVIQRWQGQSNSINDPNAVCGEDEEVEESDLAFLASNTPSRWLWEEEGGDEKEQLDKALGQEEGKPTLSDELSVLTLNKDNHLPSTTAEETESNSNKQEGMSQAKKEHCLSSATPEEIESSSKQESLSQQKNAKIARKKKAAWSMKETSCDVELDVHVSSILNIKSVIKSLPEDENESKNIHWRAVPSLREIWHEERRRMAKLLEPQHDFLSRQSTPSSEKKHSKVTPPFTLSVKKDASTPGAILAAKGMKRLLNVTDGLEQDFMRAARQIVQRYSDAISRVDRMLHETPTTRKSLYASSNSTVAGSDASQAPQSQAPQLTPTVDDALNALGALASQFDRPSEDANAHLLDVCDSEEEDENPVKADNTPAYGERGLVTPRLMSQNCDTLRRAIQEDSPMDQFELSQRIDRGDSIVDGQNVEDHVDPKTLVPFDSMRDEADDDSDEDDLDEAGMERVLTNLGTQLIARDGQKTGPSPEGEAIMGVEHTLDVGKRDSVLEHSDSESCASSSTIKADDEVSSDESATAVARAPVQTKEFEPKVKPAQNGILPALKPPSRGAIHKSHLGLNRLSVKSRVGAASWLPHASAYEKSRLKRKAKSQWGQHLSATKFYIQPTRQPPRRDEVKYWQHKLTKRRLSTTDGAARKKIKLSDSGKGKKYASATHEVDSNTGKIVPAGKKGAVNASDTTGSTGEVEEVCWLPSQSQAFSVTQDEQAPNSDLRQQPAKRQPTLTAGSAMDSQSLKRIAQDISTPAASSSLTCPKSDQPQALQGMQNQGGRLVVEGGGQLKAKTRPSQAGARKGQQDDGADLGNENRYLPSPLTMMSIEVHVQCRTGRAGVSNANVMAMTADSDRDRLFAIAYAYGRDPGGGAALEVLERGCLFVAVEREDSEVCDDRVKASLPREIFGVTSPLTVESVRDEKQLLLRLASVVRRKDPDMLLSWDSQGAGLGYIVERGESMGNPGNADTSDGRASKLDMARLLGRLPRAGGHSKAKVKEQAKGGGGEGFFADEEGQPELGKEKKSKDQATWSGSGLGAEWDDRVGAGRAAASIAGRLVFAGWKIIAEEVKHPNYSSLNAMVSAVLSKRIPFHDDLSLAGWYACSNGRERWRVLHYRLVQCTATLQLFDALDIVGRAGEAARLSGVEFSQSFPGVRGSQYKVEGVLLRALQSLNSEERGCKTGQYKGVATGDFSALSEQMKSQADSPWKNRRKAESEGAKENNAKLGYFFFSPSLKDTEKQEALEVQALTLEPQSGHQTDPVVVCDFTALYPSLMIAYNLCYSTCAGRLSYHTTRREMYREGMTTGRLGPFRYSENRTATVLKHHLKSIGSEGDEGAHKMSSKDRVYIAPTGTMFVSESVVRGVLPQVLDEMLSTRAMLKKASKEYKKRVKGLSPSILRQLEARQLALKYVANVTYGYTSATFSGRCAMPLLADTIVECGRRTLTNAINLANSWGRQPGGKWHGCEVLYGDTDSCFIKLPGRSVNEAFDFGEAFCSAVTAANPPPVQLKLEKVYLGSILQTKKKYCGMKFESRNAKAPEFEAKGIETVRRDQCALTQKVLRNTLIMLFRHGIHAVKDYLYRQWSLILAGKLPVSDFIITGKVRSKYRGGRIGPVQAALFRRLAEADPGRVMRNKERISYVIVATPGASYRLKDCVLTPMELLAQWDSYTLHSTYYIVKHVNAALGRCLSLAPHFIKVNEWYEDCPKPRRRIHFWPVTRTGSSAMISSYFGSDICSLCGVKCLAQGRSRAVVCANCRRDDVMVALTASKKLQKVQEEAMAAARVCSSCNLCFEDASTFAPERTGDMDTISNGVRQHGIATPIAACICIDCPNTYKRHRLREDCLEMEEICKALDLI